MAGRDFGPPVQDGPNKPNNRIKAAFINDLRAASIEDNARIDEKADAADVSAALAGKASNAALIAHEADTTNPHDVTAAQTGAYTTGQTDAAIAAATGAVASDLAAHEADTANPHNVTAPQVGLGNVPNVNTTRAAITFVFDGQGADIDAGEAARVVMPYAATVVGWRVVASSAGTFTSTVRRSTFAAYPVMTAISGTEGPALSAAAKAEDLTLTTWTAALAAGDVVELLVTAATVPWVSVQLMLERT